MKGKKYLSLINNSRAVINFVCSRFVYYQGSIQIKLLQKSIYVERFKLLENKTEPKRIKNQLRYFPNLEQDDKKLKQIQLSGKKLVKVKLQNNILANIFVPSVSREQAEKMILQTSSILRILQSKALKLTTHFRFCSSSDSQRQTLEDKFDKSKIDQIPTLKQFISQQSDLAQDQHQQHIGEGSAPIIESFQALSQEQEQPENPSIQSLPLKYHIETYGCQMNVNDSEIVRSIFSSNPQLFNPSETKTPEEANIVFLNTCAIRDSAEQRIFARIRQLKALKSIKVLGLLGCMAERLREKMFAEGVNIIAGPDTYRDLPKLIETSLSDDTKRNQMNVQLSVEQTYADITPVRRNISKISAFLSIMRGCNNMCSFCIVPFVRGRQRSRNIDTILKQIEILQADGVKEVTFLGQNVNSYHDTSKQSTSSSHQNSAGFSQTFKLRNNPGVRFGELLQISAKAFPDLRFRFTSPHPKDFPDDVLEKIATYPNLCKYIHLPAQSGNTEMLFKMRRNHTREAYLNLVQKMREMIPTLALSTDLICGFCGQTEEQFQDTLNLLREVKYDNAFLFMYSMREKTHAHRNYVDDVPLEIKKARLQRMIDVFTETQRPLNQKELNQTHLLLIENTSKKDQNKWIGKTDNFKKAVVEKGKAPFLQNGSFEKMKEIELGDYVVAQVEVAGARSLGCRPIAILQKLSDYSRFESKILELRDQKAEQVC